MTSREAYVMGWVYGHLEYAILQHYHFDNSKKYDKSGFKYKEACGRPFSAFAAIHAAALRDNIMTPELSSEIGSALFEINSLPETTSGSETHQPLHIQGVWQIGQSKGASGAPLPPEKDDFDIKLKRVEKGMTQAQLGGELGVDQAQISRWEKGLNVPSKEMLNRLRELLS